MSTARVDAAVSLELGNVPVLHERRRPRPFADLPQDPLELRGLPLAVGLRRVLKPDAQMGADAVDVSHEERRGAARFCDPFHRFADLPFEQMRDLVRRRVKAE